MAQVSGEPPYYTLLGRASSDILKACLSPALVGLPPCACHSRPVQAAHSCLCLQQARACARAGS